MTLPTVDVNSNDGNGSIVPLIVDIPEGVLVIETLKDASTSSGTDDRNEFITSPDKVTVLPDVVIFRILPFPNGNADLQISITASVQVGFTWNVPIPFSKSRSKNARDLSELGKGSKLRLSPLNPPALLGSNKKFTPSGSNSQWDWKFNNGRTRLTIIVARRATACTDIEP